MSEDTSQSVSRKKVSERIKRYEQGKISCPQCGRNDWSVADHRGDEYYRKVEPDGARVYAVCACGHIVVLLW